MPADASADRAELSALTTAVEELTKRITLIIERYSGGVRDDVLAALEGAERALVQASRRLDVATARQALSTRVERLGPKCGDGPRRGRLTQRRQAADPGIATNQVAGTWLRL